MSSVQWFAMLLAFISCLRPLVTWASSAHKKCAGYFSSFLLVKSAVHL